MLSTVHPANDVRIVRKEAVTLANQNHELIVIANYPGLESSDKIKYILHHYGKLSRWKRPILGGFNILKLVHKIKPDVIHFHDPELIPFGLIFKTLGYKVVYDIHEDTPEDIRSKEWIPKIIRPIISRSLALIERYASRHFDAVVTATPYIAKRIQTKKIRPTVVRNYASLSEFNPIDSMREKKLQAVYVGRISFNRGLVEMTEACRNVKIPLILAGPANPKEIEWMKSNSEIITWKGLLNRQEISELLAESYVGLCVLHHEPNYLNALPIKLFEYMAAGLPVITSDLPISQGIVNQSACGYIVPAQNTLALSQTLIEMIKNPSETAALGRNGYTAIENKYNWEKESTTLIALYNAM